MTAPHVAVVGGGIAGLSAAIECADRGARVTLFEERTRLGGATWSTRRHGVWVDNGQHVFLRCCTSYLDFLRRLGVESRVRIQPRLSIPVVSPERTARLERNRLPAPLHLTGSVLRYAHLTRGERVRIARAASALARLDPNDSTLDATSFGEWLAARGQSDRAIDCFWDLIARAALNLPARRASLQLATVVFQTGLLTARDAGDIGVARVPLQALHAEPAARLLASLGADVVLRAPVARVASDPQKGPRVELADGSLEADAVIVAAPPEAAAALLPADAGVDAGDLHKLGTSPIVNLHVFYDRPVTDLAFAAGVDTPVQWVFDRTEASGAARGQYLAVSLSAADAYVGVSTADLRARFLPELGRLFPAARRARVTRFFATCERAATFLQVPGRGALRPGTTTRAPDIHLAGAWTDTGWPDTMEGAVRSGLAAARAALASLHRPRRPSARAA